MKTGPTQVCTQDEIAETRERLDGNMEYVYKTDIYSFGFFKYPLKKSCDIFNSPITMRYQTCRVCLVDTATASVCIMLPSMRR